MFVRMIRANALDVVERGYGGKRQKKMIFSRCRNVCTDSPSSVIKRSALKKSDDINKALTGKGRFNP